MKLSRELLLGLYRNMMRIRLFEQKAIELYSQNLIAGTIHPCLGQEAMPAGVSAALRKDDYVTSNHRGHGHCAAKGGDLARMMAELLGKETGYCRGRGGSMHIADLSLGILGANGIVAGGIPIAVGAALSARLRGTDQVVACFFGDAAVNQGAFHEGVNLAAAWKLPVVFVCENNLYGVSTRITETFPLEKIADRAAGYGIPGVTVDGNDVLAVYKAAQEAVGRARDGKGPALLVGDTYRWEGHFYGEPGLYRTKEELESWKAADPIPRFAGYLAEKGWGAEVERIAGEVKDEVERAARFAIESPLPDPATLLDNVFVPF